MNISIILAHPIPEVSTTPLAKRRRKPFRQNRHQVTLHDLYQEQFPPLFSAAELQTTAQLEPVSPVIAGKSPGPMASSSSIPTGGACRRRILKGWIDRVLADGNRLSFCCQ